MNFLLHFFIKYFFLFFYYIVIILFLEGNVVSANEHRLDSEETIWYIESINFEGFIAVSSNQARQVIETKQPTLVSLYHKIVLNKSILEYDRLRIRSLYQEYGFFQVELSLILDLHPQRGTVTIIFVVQENQPALLYEIRVLLPNLLIAEEWKELLCGVITLIPGSCIRIKDYEESKYALGQILANNAYPKHRVNGQIQIYPEEKKAIVVFQIDFGPKLFFGLTEIKGEGGGIWSKFILRQLTYIRGQPFSQDLLISTQRRILDSGFFNLVNFDPDFENVANGELPIIIEVKEARRHSIRLGFGWGAEEQFRLSILQVNRNLFHLSDILNFEGKLSLIYQGVVGRLKLPQIPTPLTDILFNGGAEQKNRIAYENRRFFINPMIEYRMPGYWSWFIGYNLEYNYILSFKVINSLINFFEKDRFRISSFPIGIKFDNRDSLLDSKRGIYFVLDLEAASTYLGSEIDFIKFLLDIRYIFPISWYRDSYLASRIKVGLVSTFSELKYVPVIRRFYIGGADSIRGYPYQRLGPLDPLNMPLGGELMFESGVEFRYPVFVDLGGVLFIDMGNVYECISSDIENLRFTVGTGLRYQTILGPIRLDFGYQLNSPNRFSYNKYEFYISVGQFF